MRAARVWLAAVLLVSSSAAVRAEEPADGSPAAPKEFPRLKLPSLVHTMQFGLAVMPGTGFRGIFPYKDQIPCGEVHDGQLNRVCTGRLPVFIDGQISYGVARRWDLLVEMRFGVERDFTGTRQLAVAPGFRYWVDPEQPVKFFAGLQGVLDITDQQNPAVENKDFAVRNANGFMFEVMRNLGIYLQLAETLGFRRWLRFEVDFGVGVQARFP